MFGTKFPIKSRLNIFMVIKSHYTMNKKILITAMLLAGCLGLSQAQDSSEVDIDHIKSITAVSKVLGDGRKLSNIIVEYDAPIKNKSLSTDSYMVNGREISRVYSNTQPETATKGSDGPYVIIELADEAQMGAHPAPPAGGRPGGAPGRQGDRPGMSGNMPPMGGGPGGGPGGMPGGRPGNGPGGRPERPDNNADRAPQHEPGQNVFGPMDSLSLARNDGHASVAQTKDIRTTGKKTYEASNFPMESTAAKCLVADDFRQEEFAIPNAGHVLHYNIYLPEDYTASEKYPLVLFIQDTGRARGPVTRVLYQGNGATSWAEPEAQQRHKCIVVAPDSRDLDATIALVKDLQTKYSIDSDRIYISGQSMGCMASIAMMQKEPDMFAGALLVAGRWNPEITVPLNQKNIWIISSEGEDSNALYGQTVAKWREQGSEVAEATWDVTLSVEQLNAEADAMRAEGKHLMFTVLSGADRQPAWFVAYGIPSIQDWLLEQHK